MNPKPKCILHFGAGSEDGQVIVFKKQTLERCKLSLESRGVNSKYNSISLPNNLSPECGYHIKCYSNFTAVTTKKPSQSTTQTIPAENETVAVEKTVAEKIPVEILAEGTEITKEPTSYVCDFCKQFERKIRGKRNINLSTCTDSEIIDRIASDADCFYSNELQDRIRGRTKIHYHKQCLALFEKKVNQIKNKSNGCTKQEASDAILFLFEYIEEQVINQRKALTLTEVHKIYVHYVSEHSSKSAANYSSQNLQKKILKRFKGEVVCYGGRGKYSGNILYSKNSSVKEMIRDLKSFQKSDCRKIEEAALILRKEVLRAAKNATKLPTNLNPADIIKGEINPVQPLEMFLETLLCGIDKRYGHIAKQERKIRSFSDNIIYSVTNGKVKPASLMILGLSIKSLTHSKKILQILNRLGYSINYDCVEELETELAYTHQSEQAVTPAGISKVGDGIVGVAWDNYDCFVDTLTGKGTLHDTVGICFQSQSDNNLQPEASQELSLPIPSIPICFEETNRHDDGASLSPFEDTLETILQKNPGDELCSQPLLQHNLAKEPTLVQTKAPLHLMAQTDDRHTIQEFRDLAPDMNDVETTLQDPHDNNMQPVATRELSLPDASIPTPSIPIYFEETTTRDGGASLSPFEDTLAIFLQKNPGDELCSQSLLEHNQAKEPTLAQTKAPLYLMRQTDDSHPIQEFRDLAPDMNDVETTLQDPHDNNMQPVATRELSLPDASIPTPSIPIYFEETTTRDGGASLSPFEDTLAIFLQKNPGDELCSQSLLEHNQAKEPTLAQTKAPLYLMRQTDDSHPIQEFRDLAPDMNDVETTLQDPHDNNMQPVATREISLPDASIPTPSIQIYFEETTTRDGGASLSPFEDTLAIFLQKNPGDELCSQPLLQHNLAKEPTLVQTKAPLHLIRRTDDRHPIQELCELAPGIDDMEITILDAQIDSEHLNLVETTNESNTEFDNENDKTHSKRRRRTIKINEEELEPYRKKPRMIQNQILIPYTDERRQSIPESFTSGLLMEKLWLISLIFKNSETPMWVGWNAQLSIDKLKEHVITYLTQINRSPTAYDVVAETMRRSLRIAQECNQKYIIVTYDLAIAKMAFKIQCEDNPTYDNVFIMLGPFHITMAFFKAIGKYIDGSGGIDILVESGLLAEGSVNGFISGTHYNRCKKIHTLLAAAMSIMHFDQFKKRHESANVIFDEIGEFVTNEGWMLLETEYECETIKKVIKKYETFSANTENGEHGKTAQFWYTYMKFIELYHLFSRSIRCGDYKLYTYVIGKMCNVFFAMNQPNYARWLTKMHSNMCTMEETHPGIVEQFEKGALSIRRTSKNFARTAVDLTLEQTVNADAASSSRGIVAMTNSLVARQRWAITHSARTTILTHLLEKLDLTSKDDITPDLRKSDMSKNRINLNNLVQKLSDSLNPFDENVDKCHLHNLSTGRAASEQTANFLLNIESIGENVKKTFIDECVKSPNRFEKPIKRTEMKSFASDTKAMTEKKKDGTVVELKMDRNVIGRLLCLSIEHNINLEEILSYPITPLPLALCHLDHSFVSTNKAMLLRDLEKKIQSGKPSHVIATIVDGMFLLHTLGDLPMTFGDIARRILIKVMKLDGNEIHLVFDHTRTPSIKDYERDRRSLTTDRQRPYDITGGNMKRPSNFLKALRNDNFKTALVKFLAKEWEENQYAVIIGQKKLFVTHNEHCLEYKSTLIANKHYAIEKNIAENYTSSLEEADSRMFFHIAQVTVEGDVVIRTNDTDVLVIALANRSHIPSGIHMWLELGVAANNTLRFVDVDELHRKIGPKLSLAMSGFHAFTGCDYNPAFYGKGKTRPLSILEKNENYVDAFGQLGNNLRALDSKTEKNIEKFVCQIYGMPRFEDVNKARYNKFLTAYRPSVKSPFGNIKGIDQRTLPPCRKVLQQHLLRANYIAGIWNNAYSGQAVHRTPEGEGWILKEHKYTPVWYQGERIPPTLEAVLGGDTELDKETEEALNKEGDENYDIGLRTDYLESDDSDMEEILGV